MSRKSKYVDVLVDSREQYPLLFPETLIVPGSGKRPQRLKVRTFTEKLDSGDYSLKKYPRGAVIERKGSANEIIKNLFNKRDARRQGKAFKRLADNSSAPYLLIAVNPSEFAGACRNKRVPQAPDYPDLVYHRLASVVKRYGLGLLWMSSTKSAVARRTMGSIVLNIMLADIK